MQAVEHGAAESISIEPDWEGFRRWVLLVNETNPELARHMAAYMGSEAPDLPRTCATCDHRIDGAWAREHDGLCLVCLADPTEPGSFDYPDFE